MRIGMAILIAAALFFFSAQYVHAETWGITADPIVKGQKVKARVSLSYFDPATGRLVKKRYKPASVEFHLREDDLDGAADTDIIISGEGLTNLTASMHGSIFRIGPTSYISGCFNSDNEAGPYPFNFDDGEVGITSEKVKSTAVEGLFKKVLSKGVPTGEIRLKFTYSMVGMTEDGNMANIVVVLSATAQQQVL